MQQTILRASSSGHQKMSGSGDGQEDNRVSKRQKRESKGFLNFPNELIQLVFSSLNKRDIINLSSTNRKYRSRLFGFVFKQIFVSWEDMNVFVKEVLDSSDILSSKLFSKLLRAVQELVVYKPNKKLEWHLVPELNLLVTRLHRTEVLKIEVSSASYCLKYFDFKKQIKTLYIKTEKLNSAFNLEHLHQFDRVERLILENFRFTSFNNDIDILNRSYKTGQSLDPDTKKQGSFGSRFVFINTGHEVETDVLLPFITNLQLINCSWDYPFKLTQFLHNKHDNGVESDYSNNLTSIDLSYSNDNNFLLSERLKQFLSHPIVSPSMESFRLDIRGNNEIVKFANIEAYLNIDDLRSLKNIKLLGIPFQDCGYLGKLLTENHTLRRLQISYATSCFHNNQEKEKIENQTVAYINKHQRRQYKLAFRLGNNTS